MFEQIQKQNQSTRDGDETRRVSMCQINNKKLLLCQRLMRRQQFLLCPMNRDILNREISTLIQVQNRKSIQEAA